MHPDLNAVHPEVNPLDQHLDYGRAKMSGTTTAMGGNTESGIEEPSTYAIRSESTESGIGPEPRKVTTWTARR